MMGRDAMMKPKRVKEMLPPGHFYPRLDISYEGWIEFEQKMKEVDNSFRLGHLRSIIHEIYVYADGKTTITDIAKKIGLECGITLDPETLIPLLESLERFGSITIENKYEEKG